MIYSGESLLSSTSVTRTKVFNENESIFIYGLQLLESQDRDIQNMLTTMIRESIVENKYLCESFDIGEVISKIIEWFIETIKNIFHRFKAYITKILYMDSAITKYKNQILSFDDAIEVDFERYLFTCTNPNIPKCGLIDHFEREFDNLKEMLKDIDGVKNQADRLEIMRRIHATIDEQSGASYYANARSSCLGLTYPIAEENYAKELFNIYRNGGEFYTPKVNRNEVEEVYNRFTNAKKLIKEVEKQKDDIIRAAKAVEKEIKSIKLKDISKDYIPYDVSEEEAFDRIRRIKIDQISKVANIYVLAFSAKMDAIKDSISQDKRLLFEILTYMEVQR